MSNEADRTGTRQEFLTRSSDWLRRSRALATQVGRTTEVEAASSLFLGVDRPGVRVVVAGGLNAGKSRLINRFLCADLLPVSVLAGAREFILEAAGSGEEESLVMEDGTSRPIAELSKVLETASTHQPITLRLNRKNLSNRNLTLMEAQMNASEEEMPGLVARLLSSGDVVVVVLDSNAPMRRTEQCFLEECRVRGLPTIVAVAKADQIPPEDRDELFDYVSGKLADPDRTPIVAIPDTDDSIGELIAALEGTLIELDPIAIRARQVGFALIEALERLLADASAAREQKSRAMRDREESVYGKKQEMSRGDLVWQELQLALQRRRQSLEELLRKHLETHRQSLLDSLHHEVEKAGDIKVWWERDLPFQLQRDLRALGAQLGGRVNRQMVEDLRWLRDELQRRLGYPLPAMTDDVQLDAEMPALEKQPLSDTNFLKIATRLASGAGIFAATALLATTGIGGVALVSSMGMGVLSEQYMRIRTNRDRALVRNSLETVITKAELAYLGEVSSKLSQSYERILDDLKRQQLGWQQGQMRSLKDFAGQPDDPAISGAAAAVEPIQALLAEVRSATLGG